MSNAVSQNHFKDTEQHTLFLRFYNDKLIPDTIKWLTLLCFFFSKYLKKKERKKMVDGEKNKNFCFLSCILKLSLSFDIYDFPRKYFSGIMFKDI